MPLFRRNSDNLINVCVLRHAHNSPNNIHISDLQMRFAISLAYRCWQGRIETVTKVYFSLIYKCTVFYYYSDPVYISVRCSFFVLCRINLVWVWCRDERTCSQNRWLFSYKYELHKRWTIPLIWRNIVSLNISVHNW